MSKNQTGVRESYREGRITTRGIRGIGEPLNPANTTDRLRHHVEDGGYLAPGESLQAVFSGRTASTRKFAQLRRKGLVEVRSTEYGRIFAVTTDRILVFAAEFGGPRNGDWFAMVPRDVIAELPRDTRFGKVPWMSPELVITVTRRDGQAEEIWVSTNWRKEINAAQAAGN